MHSQLSPEQNQGAAWLASKSVCMLADEPGFGKTAQLAHACDLVLASTITGIMPPILRTNIGAEFDLWSVFGEGIYTPAVLKDGKGRIPPSGLLATSYQLASQPHIIEALRARRPDVLILDEAHALKGPSKRTAAILGVGGIAERAKRVWFATGTPDPNHAGELYPFAAFCGAWRGSYNDFLDEFCVSIEGPHGRKVVGNRNAAKLKELLSPYILRRTRPDDAPPYIDEIAVEGREPDFSGVPPDVLASIQYVISQAEAGAPVDWDLLSGAAIATVRRQLGVAKAEDVAELTAYALETCHKAIVFALHTPVIDTIAAGLFKARRRVGIIDGRTSAGRRDELIKEFQRPESDLRALVLQGAAAGEGITLTQADRVLIAEPHWSPDGNWQWIRRAARRGQTRKVHASFIYLSRSFDAMVARVLARKARDKIERAISA